MKSIKNKAAALIALGASLVGSSQCNPSDVFSVNTADSANAVCWDTIDQVIHCYANNWPAHEWGPWAGNHDMFAHDFDFNICLYPEKLNTVTPIEPDASDPACGNGIIWGVSLQGTIYSPYARLYFVNPNTGVENENWTEEAAFLFNMDANGGHVNAINRYHYHEIPWDWFINEMGIDGSTHSPIVGYAADGFPIYYKYICRNPHNLGSPIDPIESGWHLKPGNRPGNGITAPDGPYDGHYVEDYEFDQSTTELDECGMRWGKTPEYPDGTFYYVLTDNFPWIPRCFNGKVDYSFKIGPNCPPSDAAQTCAIDPTNFIVDEIMEDVQIFPNPVKDQLNLSFTKGNEELVLGVEVLDINGAVVKRWKTLNSSYGIEELAPGTYFLQVLIGENPVTKKFVVQ